jgi:predicted porin
MQITKAGVVTGLMLCSASLHAQTSVTVYGVADAGIEVVDRVPLANGTSASAVRIQSGNAQSSRVGFRGREDLGHGLSAVFTLENGFDLSDGTLSNGGRLFGRSAYVGLNGRFGEIQLGRQTTVIYDFAFAFDPSAPTRYSTPMFDPAFVGRADNAIKYIGKFGALGVRAQYSTGFNGIAAGAGEVPGAYKVGKEFGVAAEYGVAKNVLVGLVYDRQNGTSVANQHNKDERSGIAATVDLKPVKLFLAAHRLSKSTPATRTDTKLYWTGVQYQAAPALWLAATVYYQDSPGNAGNPLSFSLFGSHALSKRTDLYSQIGFARNRDGSNLGLNGFGSVARGENQRGLTLGLRTRF